MQYKYQKHTQPHTAHIQYMSQCAKTPGGKDVAQTNWKQNFIIIISLMGCATSVWMYVICRIAKAINAAFSVTFFGLCNFVAFVDVFRLECALCDQNCTHNSSSLKRPRRCLVVVSLLLNVSSKQHILGVVKGVYNSCMYIHNICGYACTCEFAA